MTPALSVVIPTHNRRASLQRLLDGLAAGALPADRFEVIVVADGCRDDTVPWARAARYPYPLTVLDRMPGGGAASARNLGAEQAQAPVLLFIDDDIEPLPGTLAAHLALHGDAVDDPTVVIGAPIPVREPGAGFHRIALWAWWEQQFERMTEPGHRFGYAEIFSGLLSVPRELFRDVGGFAAVLRSCRDDSELGLRLMARGARVVFSREAGGLHHDARDRTRLAERKAAEGRADVELARLHPELRRDLRLALPWGPVTSATGILLRVAFFAPWVGRLLVALVKPALGLTERLRLRGAWRQLHGLTMYFAYWEGVARHLGGGRTAATALRALMTAPAPPPAVRSIAVDLADGLDAAGQRLDRERPDAVRVLLGGEHVGWLPAVPGAERLRGTHLREQLARELAWELSVALAWERTVVGAAGTAVSA